MQSTPESIQFHVKVETDVKKVYTQIQNILKNYKKEVTGPTLLLVQSPIGKKKDVAKISKNPKFERVLNELNIFCHKNGNFSEV